jgi:pimeloyl-ACP methyl ester carboxylesterase
MTRRFLLWGLLALMAQQAEAPDRITVESVILGESRQAFVALPDSFSKTGPSRRYPLIIVTDGEGPSARAVVTAARELSRNGLMPEAVIVGVENIDRLRDLTPPGLSVSGSSLNEGGDRFLDFLERELIPAVDAKYRTAAPRVLVGHSSGGILATYAAATRDTFRLVVALDTPTHLGENWLPDKLTARARAGGAPIRYASYSAVYGWSDRLWSELIAAAPSNWLLRSEKLANETHNSMPLLGSYLGLREIFVDTSRKAAPVFPTTSVLPYYAKLAPAFGGPIVPPLPLMRDVVEDLMLEGRGAEAKAAFDQLVDAYGEPSDAADTRARISEVESRPAPSETVESLLATPFATPSEAAPYLGRWEGESRMGEHQRTRFVLTLSVENDRVTGRVVFTFAPGEELVQELQYFTVQEDGFTYGYMNGMRPRGMLLYPMRRTAGGFEGVMRWGGVAAPVHEGQAAPPEHVVLLRRAK